VLWAVRVRLLLGASLLAYLWVALFGLVFRVTGVRAADYRGQVGPDVEAQLAFIRDTLHAPGSAALRQPNSVWTVFAHTLYGFTLVHTVLQEPDNQARRAGAIRELEWILEQLERPEAMQDFADTQVPHDVFYLGERNLTLAGLMLIGPDPNPDYEREYHHASRLLYEAFMASPSAHLDTFPGHAWPANNVPALYSLVSATGSTARTMGRRRRVGWRI
jgi:hypothetical protein